MRYRKLGSTGLKISEIGFGGIPLQKVPLEESKQIIETAQESGINFFDSARAYTDSEQKIGLGLDEKSIASSRSNVRTKEGMLREIETSLRNFGREKVELYSLHNVGTMEEYNRATTLEGALEGLREARKEGRLEHIGITSHSPDILLKALKDNFFEAIMLPFNAREVNSEVVDFANEQGVGVLVMKPLGGGAIQNAGLALRFILDYKVSSVLVGMESREQVRQNCRVEHKPLSTEEREKLKTEIEALGNRFCRRCSYCLPCPQGIDIPLIFILDGYYTRYGLKDFALSRYRPLKKHAGDCTECGTCEERCPYNLPIREMLREAGKHLG